MVKVSSGETARLKRRLLAFFIDLVIFAIPFSIAANMEGFYVDVFPMPELQEEKPLTQEEEKSPVSSQKDDSPSLFEHVESRMKTFYQEHYKDIMGAIARYIGYISYMFYLFYDAFFTSTPWQGSLGKRFVGIYVVHEKGGKIGFFHAFLRALLAWVSKLSIIGYVMVALSPERVAWHDKVCKTRVLVGEAGK